MDAEHVARAAAAQERVQSQCCRGCVALRSELAAVYTELDRSAFVMLAERRRADEAETGLAYYRDAAGGRRQIVLGAEPYLNGESIGMGTDVTLTRRLHRDRRSGTVRCTFLGNTDPRRAAAAGQWPSSVGLDAALMEFLNQRDAMTTMSGSLRPSVADIMVEGRRPAPAQPWPAADAMSAPRLEGGASRFGSAHPSSAGVVSRAVLPLGRQGASAAVRSYGMQAPVPVSSFSSPTAAAASSFLTQPRNQNRLPVVADAARGVSSFPGGLYGASSATREEGTGNQNDAGVDNDARKDTARDGERKSSSSSEKGNHALVGGSCIGLKNKTRPHLQGRGEYETTLVLPKEDEPGEPRATVKEEIFIDESIERASDRKRKAEDVMSSNTLDRVGASPGNFNPTLVDDSAEKFCPDAGSTSTGTGTSPGGDIQCRGDPRMNRAVTAKLENPSTTLRDALLEGGFSFPFHNGGVSDGGSKGVGDMFARGASVTDKRILDREGVSLYQRKNQLNRRLRRIRAEQRGEKPKSRKKAKQESQAEAGVDADGDSNSEDS